MSLLLYKGMGYIGDVLLYLLICHALWNFYQNATAMKVIYLCTLVHGEELRQFDSLSADVEGTDNLTTEAIILGLGA